MKYTQLKPKITGFYFLKYIWLFIYFVVVVDVVDYVDVVVVVVSLNLLAWT